MQGLTLYKNKNKNNKNLDCLVMKNFYKRTDKIPTLILEEEYYYLLSFKFSRSKIRNSQNSDTKI